MSAIDRIKARRDRFSREARPFIDVPEWGDETGPLRIFWKPVTPLDVSKSKLNENRGNAELIALKAEDAAGNRMFPEIDDAETLYKIGDALIIGRIALAMMAVPSIQDAAKN